MNIDRKLDSHHIMNEAASLPHAVDMFVHYLQIQCELFYGQSAVTPAHHQRAAQLQVKVQQSHLNFHLR